MNSTFSTLQHFTELVSILLRFPALFNILQHFQIISNIFQDYQYFNSTFPTLYNILQNCAAAYSTFQYFAELSNSLQHFLIVYQHFPGLYQHFSNTLQHFTALSRTFQLFTAFFKSISQRFPQFPKHFPTLFSTFQIFPKFFSTFPTFSESFQSEKQGPSTHTWQQIYETAVVAIKLIEKLSPPAKPGQQHQLLPLTPCQDEGGNCGLCKQNPKMLHLIATIGNLALMRLRLCDSFPNSLSRLLNWFIFVPGKFLANKIRVWAKVSGCPQRRSVIRCMSCHYPYQGRLLLLLLLIGAIIAIDILSELIIRFDARAGAEPQMITSLNPSTLSLLSFRADWPLIGFDVWPSIRVPILDSGLAKGAYAWYSLI